MKAILPSKQGVGASCITLPEGAARDRVSLIDFLSERFAHVTREEWQRRFTQGEVCDDIGTALQADALCRSQMKVLYYRSVAHEARVPFEAQVLYADAHLVVADKPHFLPVTPSGHYVQETLLARLKLQLHNDALVPLHRIDRDTAGLVMFSANAVTRGAYQALFRERRVSKRYEAIAPYRTELRLPMHHRCCLETAAHFMQMQLIEGEPNSVTDLDLLAQSGQWARYELKPHTGKRHQLRVVMNALGVPILNDGIYPLLTPETPEPDYTKPLQLLAQQLSFTDPLTNALREFKSLRALSWPVK